VNFVRQINRRKLIKTRAIEDALVRSWTGPDLDGQLIAARTNDESSIVLHGWGKKKGLNVLGGGGGAAVREDSGANPALRLRTKESWGISSSSQHKTGKAAAN